MLGRKYEYHFIKERIQSKQAELGIVYGRRRVGKSTLLRALKDESKSLYFEGIRGLSLQAQINHFCKQLAEQTGSVPAKATTWADAFDALTYHIKKSKWYIVFDEFPWMANEKTALVALLKYYWDNKWKTNTITLVLCGSIIQFMVKHLVHSDSLHDRKTFELKIEPLSCSESSEFFKNKRSSYEVTKFLMVFGGIPKYLEQINPNQSLEKNMDQLCFKKGGFFINEFETVFKEQFRVIKVYENIVNALAAKKCTKEQISKIIGMGSGGGLTTYLTNLEQAGFIRKETSLHFGSQATKSKTVRYALSDEWLEFYFTFMQSRMTVISKNINEGLFNSITAKSISNYFGFNFEKFCYKNIEIILNLLEIKSEDVVNLGPFFQQSPRSKSKNTGVQIDLLIQRSGNVFTLVECKFRDDPIGSEVIKEVQRKIARLAVPKKYTIERVLIAANGVLPSVEDADYFHKIITLDDFY